MNQKREKLSKTELKAQAERVKIGFEIYDPTLYDEEGKMKQSLLGFIVGNTSITDPSRDDEKIGSIDQSFGFDMIRDKRTGRTWHVDHKQLWIAYCDAMNLPYGALNDDKETNAQQE